MTDEDAPLRWIAREGLKAPLPENWKPCKTGEAGEVFYFNFATGESVWDHPCDEHYRKFFEEEKRKRALARAASSRDRPDPHSGRVAAVVAPGASLNKLMPLGSLGGPDPLGRVGGSRDRTAAAAPAVGGSRDRTAAPVVVAKSGADRHEREDKACIFVQSPDLRWCLLHNCEFESLAVLRHLCSAFVLDVPRVINSKDWQLKHLCVILHKKSKDSKLGLYFYQRCFRRDPHADDGVAIIRVPDAAGKLMVGERIMSVQGHVVRGPLHAVWLLRELEGYLIIKKQPKRPDFEAKYQEYAQIEAGAIPTLVTLVQAIPTLVTLVQSGTDGQKEQAAVALGFLAHSARHRVAIAQAGAIAPLVTLLRSGTDAQKWIAASTLGFLAHDAEHRVLIAQAGAIAPLVTLLQSGTDGQGAAAAVLRNLAYGSFDRQKKHAAAALRNKNAIAQAGGIAPLVALVQSGTDGQKDTAAGALWNLSFAAGNKVAIAQAGGIAPLVTLLQRGTDGQKESAAGALATLALHAENQVLIAQAGAIAPLVTLMQSGTDRQKWEAAIALGNLADAGNRVAILQAGAIAPLVTLMQSGTDRQKEQAVGALRNLAQNAENQVMIAQAGAIAPLVTLVQSGTIRQKKKAVRLLGIFAIARLRTLVQRAWS